MKFVKHFIINLIFALLIIIMFFTILTSEVRAGALNNPCEEPKTVSEADIQILQRYFNTQYRLDLLTNHLDCKYLDICLKDPVVVIVTQKNFEVLSGSLYNTRPPIVTVRKE